MGIFLLLVYISLHVYMFLTIWVHSFNILQMRNFPFDLVEEWSVLSSNMLLQVWELSCRNKVIQIQIRVVIIRLLSLAFYLLFQSVTPLSCYRTWLQALYSTTVNFSVGIFSTFKNGMQNILCPVCTISILLAISAANSALLFAWLLDGTVRCNQILVLK